LYVTVVLYITLAEYDVHNTIICRTGCLCAKGNLAFFFEFWPEHILWL